MKIGIDGTPLTASFPCGVKHYAENLVQALSKIDKKNEYYIFSSKQVSIPIQNNFHLVTTPKVPILKRQLILPILAKRENLDVFHYLEPFGSFLFKHPGIITTAHDLNLDVIFPKTLRKKYIFMKYFCKIRRHFVYQNSKAVICVSKSTRAEIRTYFSRRKMAKILYVIYESSAPIFIRNFNNTYKDKFFLCMADFSPRKNLNTIFLAYARLPEKFRSEYKLKVVVSVKNEADRFQELARNHFISHGVEIIIAPSDTQLKKLYQSATCFLYVSLYEGFGLPILEAMACGCPVITSNYGAMKEIAGSASVLVDPTSSQEISKAMVQVASSKELRNALIIKGVKRAREFSWEKTAKQTLSVYESVCKSIH